LKLSKQKICFIVVLHVNLLQEVTQKDAKRLKSNLCQRFSAAEKNFSIKRFSQQLWLALKAGFYVNWLKNSDRIWLNSRPAPRI